MIEYEVKIGQVREFAWGGMFLVVGIDGVRVDIIKSCGTTDGVFMDWLCKNSSVISGVLDAA